MGASAGGVEALKTLARRLPADFPAALLAVLHIPPQGPSLLADILDRCGPLSVSNAGDGRIIEGGRIYVAIPDRHLLVDGEIMRVSRGPKENRFRPAIDALFRSAAYTHGPRVVGVVLTGQLDDGTSGLWAVKDRGGVTIVQSPNDSQYPSMPMSALQHVDVDHIVDLETLPGLLTQLARQPVTGTPFQEAAPSRETAVMRTENDIAAGRDPLRAGSLDLGRSTHLTCPECHGVLSVVHEGTFTRFRCHTGHAYTVRTLLADIDESIDDTLSGALRALQERSILLREAAELARHQDNLAEAEMLREGAAACETKSRVIRELIQEQAPPARELSER